MSVVDDVHVPVGARAGEYEVRALLGRGGMGTVYLGVHPVIGKEVAIKVLDPKLATTEMVVERFVREARAVNTIQHPNIIDIFAFGHSPELGHYFVMPRLRGQSLAARIEERAFSADEALPVLAEITAALDAAHAVNITHRDLKPDNIFLVADRRDGVTVQLLDFGVAKLLDQDAATATRTGVQIGTPLFMAPEQWAAEGIDHRTDVYALGIIIHTMFTRRFPFEASSAVALMNMHCLQTPTPPSAHGGPAALDRVVARALSKDKLARPQSAGELLAELTAALRTAGTTGAGGAHGVVPAVAPAIGTPAVSEVAPAIGTPAAPAALPVDLPAAVVMSTLGASSGSLDDLVPPRRPRLALVVSALSAVALVVVAVARHGDGVEPAVEPAVDARVEPTVVPAVVPADAAAPAVVPNARAAVIDAGRGGVRPAGRLDAGRPPPPADARSAPPADARSAPPADAAPARILRDAAPSRPPPDSGWGETVNPYGPSL